MARSDPLREAADDPAVVDLTGHFLGPKNGVFEPTYWPVPHGSPHLLGGEVLLMGPVSLIYVAVGWPTAEGQLDLYVIVGVMSMTALTSGLCVLKVRRRLVNVPAQNSSDRGAESLDHNRLAS